MRHFSRWALRAAAACALLFASLVVTNFVGSATAQGYLLQVGDRLDVSVLEDESLGRQVLVRPDGRISLPLAGTLQAAGRSPEALQAQIQSALAASFVEPPTVSVAVVSLAPPPIAELAEEEEEILPVFYVLGEVNAPGQYPIVEEQPVTLLQGLAIAGGPGVFAARKRIQLRRVTDSVETITVFDYDAVEDGEQQMLTTPLMDGDVIIVPEKGLFE
ncbi:MAG: polysaccharide biosynthesis/export family protein [Pseudomonadota bacterium]